VRDLPGSGRPEELLHQAGIDHVAIAEAAQRLAAEPAPRFATAGTGSPAR